MVQLQGVKRSTGFYRLECLGLYGAVYLYTALLQLVELWV